MPHGWRFRAVSRVSLSLLLALAAALPAAAAVRDNGDGTLTDLATGLTWVADPGFAAEAGLARWATRAEAIALVRAMNAGRAESFGRRDWRLPTAREAAILRAHEGGADAPRRLALPAGAGPAVEVRPVSGSALVAGIADAALVAVNSLSIGRQVVVSGDVVVDEAAAGATLFPGWGLAIDREAQIEGDVAGDRVRLERDVTVTGTAAANTLERGRGSAVGATSSPLALPVYAMLPPFAVSVPREGAEAVLVGAGEMLELPAGDYLDVEIGVGGTLILTGGVYQLGGIAMEPASRLLFRGASELRLRDRLSIGREAHVGPEEGSGLDGGDAILYVGGLDGDDGVLGSTPPAAWIDRDGSFRANLYVADGSAVFDRGNDLEGAVLARDLALGRDSTVALASFWANRPPTADPQVVETGGAASIVVVLSGDDPEGGDLTFAIADPPDSGSLTVPSPIVPPPVADPERGLVQPAITRATVTYVPDGPGGVEDAFTFTVTDPLGSFGSAVVTIDPGGTPDEPPPPPPAGLVIGDLAGTVRRDVPAILSLTGEAPDGVDLSFALLAGGGPTHGLLGPLTPGPESPVRTASLTYSPAAGFVGGDAFGFEACGVVSGVTVCEQATFSIEVVEPPVEAGELAEDIEVAAVEDVPVRIDLATGVASEGEVEAGVAAAGGARRVVGRAVGLSLASISGSVSDADGDGLGDEASPLPGSTPLLVSAGVGQSGGPGGNGTVRLSIEFEVGFFASFADDLVGATVQIPTQRGTVDALDTSFWRVGEESDGELGPDDFQLAAEEIRGVTMPVPADQAVGEDGSFSFDVLSELRATLDAGLSTLTLQGRVDESLAGPARGLQVRSTASGNLNLNLVPTLSFSTPPPFLAFQTTITDLPDFGTLLGPTGLPITAVPTTFNNSSLVTYVPNAGFVGNDSFTYELTDFSVIDAGVVTVVVQAGSCDTSAEDCEDGR